MTRAVSIGFLAAALAVLGAGTAAAQSPFVGDWSVEAVYRTLSTGTPATR